MVIRSNRKMLLLAFLPIAAIVAAHQDPIIYRKNNYIVKIEEGTLISVNPTPTSSFVLDLSNLGLQFLAENAFENSTILKNLDLGNNLLSSIPKQLFSKLGNLRHLSLANNKLTDFKKVFESLDNLKGLDISNNLLKSLEANALPGLPRYGVVYTKGLFLENINAFVFEKEPETSSEASEIYKRSISNYQNPTATGQKQDDTAIMEGRKRRDVDNNRFIKICIDNDVLKKVKILRNHEILPPICHQGQVKDHFLDLRNLGIAKFEQNWFQLDTTTLILKIHLAGNNIVTVTPELMNDLPEYVRSIDLGSNKITQLKKNILDNSHIMVINFSSNAIRQIENDAFIKMSGLYDLYLSDNLLRNTAFMATFPRRIQTLHVQRNKITEISPRSFHTIGGLMSLYLNENLIREVKSDSFYGMASLVKLDLSDNLISKIEPESFQELSDVYSIALNNNRIVSFKNGTFDNLLYLIHLHVSHNKLSNMKKNFPNGLPPNLARLDLGFNEIEKLERGNFKYESLRTLILSGNKISKIEPEALELPALTKLHLDNNRLDQLNADSFLGLENIDALNLANNSITSIPKRFTRHMNRLDELDLSYNPIYRLRNGTLYGFRKTAHNKIVLKEVPLEILDGGLFDDCD